MSWTRATVLAEVRSVIVEHADEGTEVGDSTELVSDLGIDSLGVMELVGDLEDRFRLRITDADLRDVVTLADVARAIALRLEGEGRLHANEEGKP
ncbi:MAG: acyl carrier protein [Deltaproteobacteria bacterium]|nr:acyl carrier protein [Deltaproteobacteria bacterium]